MSEEDITKDVLHGLYQARSALHKGEIGLAKDIVAELTNAIEKDDITIQSAMS